MYIWHCDMTWVHAHNSVTGNKGINKLHSTWWNIASKRSKKETTRLTTIQLGVCKINFK
jgi:hypothetical protein